MHRHSILFAQADPAAETPSPGQSGGRGSESPPPAAAIAGPVAGGSLPLADPAFPVGQPVTFEFENGQTAIGFKDPIYGFMDANGVVFPQGVVPTAWKPL